jgi:AGZA family xanthine/uracil permease-like MFS transporter
MVLINGALAAAGTIVPALTPEQLAELTAKMKNEGVFYSGLHVLGGGSILGGLVLGAIAAFIIDRKFKNAAGFALAGAVMTFFGFMHGERIGIAQTPVVAVSYFIVSGILFVCSKVVVVAPRPVEIHEPEGAHATA